MGYSPDEWMGKPLIAIINTWSDINPCHAHFKQRVEDVKRGILQAGGFPVELPAISLSESSVKPTTMLYRNLLAMETEELIRSHPIDGAVLMGGCDKTTPGLLMGATSAGVPAIYVPAGPMLRGNYKGQPLGSGSDGWKYWDERQAGTIGAEEWQSVEAGIAQGSGFAAQQTAVCREGNVRCAAVSRAQARKKGNQSLEVLAEQGLATREPQGRDPEGEHQSSDSGDFLKRQQRRLGQKGVILAKGLPRHAVAAPEVASVRD